MILENVTDEFLDWLNDCPVQWFLIGQSKEDVSYVFD